MLRRGDTMKFKAMLESCDEGVYTARFPPLLGCIMSEGDSVDEALANTKEAIELCLDRKSRIAAQRSIDREEQCSL